MKGAGGCVRGEGSEGRADGFVGDCRGELEEDERGTGEVDVIGGCCASPQLENQCPASTFSRGAAGGTCGRSQGVESVNDPEALDVLASQDILAVLDGDHAHRPEVLGEEGYGGDGL